LLGTIETEPTALQTTEGDAMASGIICQSCGIEAPTRNVDFHQNIGMLVMRTRRNIKGMLCKKCIHKHFWKMTTTTIFLGPWGTISAIVAPCFVLNNIVRYLGAIGMPAVPPNATVPVLDDKAVAQLQPLKSKLIERLNNGESMVEVAPDIARQARVTPGQVVLYVVALAKGNRPQPQQLQTRGFPVQPAKPLPVESLEPIPLEELPIAELAEELPVQSGEEPAIGL
jgi:hypothetical protein